MLALLKPLCPVVTILPQINVLFKPPIRSIALFQVLTNWDAYPIPQHKDAYLIV